MENLGPEADHQLPTLGLSFLIVPLKPTLSLSPHSQIDIGPCPGGGGASDQNLPVFTVKGKVSKALLRPSEKSEQGLRKGTVCTHSVV